MIFRATTLLTSYFLMVGCTGVVNNDGDDDDQGSGDGNDDQGIPPIDATKLVLDRNPGRPLICENPDERNVGTTPLVRLTSAEHARTVADLIAPLKIDLSRVDAAGDLRNGFVPDSALAATRTQVDGNQTGATEIGAKVAAGLSELGIAGCPPSGADKEDACFDAFVGRFVRRAYRRPLEADERSSVRALFDAQKGKGTFQERLAVVVEGVVQTPQFLYRLEFGQDEQDGRSKLSGHEMASRLSYLIWGTMPDDGLFEAAQDGGLDQASGIRDQVGRMLADERASTLAREYANLWLQLSLKRPRAEVGQKNTKVFGKYTSDTVADLNQGLDLFVQDALLGPGGGWKKLLGSQQAWVSDATAWIYDVDPPGSTNLQEISLDPDRRKGVLTQGLVLSALANSEKQAPVQRAMLVLDHFLCQGPPPPPNDVVPAPPPPEPVARTTRQRLEIEHEGQGGSCKACHQIIDGVGFAFEHYDAVGRWQDSEDGMPIDASGSLADTFDVDGDFDDAIGMIGKLQASEQVAQCHVESFFRFAAGRATEDGDGCTVAWLTDRVLASEDDFQTLVLDLSTTDAFRFRSALSREEAP